MLFFFFFKQKTAYEIYQCDWSSDVCSSDLLFMSTHSLEVAEEVCEEIAIIQEGRIIAHGTAGELRQQAGIDGNLEDIFLRLTQGEG